MSGSSDWEQAREDIRSRVDFVSLVEEYVTLKQRGKSHWGLCPFHSEDTPSFAVTPEMGIYKCFGCGEGGDVYDFVMAIEGCDFPEAMRMLGERVGVQLPRGGSGERDEDDPRQRMFAVNRRATDHYVERFWSDDGTPARRYMLDRGYDEDVLRRFEIGYASDAWEDFTEVVRRDDLRMEDAERVGLVGHNDDGDRYDRFYDRIMFPIHTASERVLGFGGRRLREDDDTPKYFNSPESPIFKKREALYGLPQARSAIREAECCLLMEGYTDVLRCHQEGFEHAVATLGTAMTESHVEVLKRYTDEVVLVYDGDDAGVQAARRGGRIAVEGGLEASVVLLPPDSDPDEMLRVSPDAFSEHLEDRVPYLQALFDWMAEEVDPDSARGKEAIVEAMVPLLEALPGEVRRRESVGWLATRLSLDESFLLELMDDRASDEGSSFHERLKRREGQTIEEVFFRSLAYQPEKFERAVEPLTAEDFSDPRSRRLMDALKEIHREGETFTPQAWVDRVSGECSDYLAGLLSWSGDSKFASGIDPVEVSRKLRVDASRRERGRLARTLSERDSEAGTLSEEEKDLLQRTVENKLREDRSRRDS